MTKENYTIEEALELNLQLIVDNAKDLAKIFSENSERVDMYNKIYMTGLVLLDKVLSGEFTGKEHELFKATLPLCKKMCKDWHKYNQRTTHH